MIPRPSLLRAAARKIPSSSLPRPQSSLRLPARHASTSAYQSQSQNGILVGTAGVVALLGWTAIFVKVGERERGQKKKKHESTSHAPTIVAKKATEASESLGAETSDQDNSQSAAYDPVTGEINWDCPCLGGMAHGPCGEEFKAAFSCFIYSEDEPKGVDCVEKFRGMQECFRKHPDIYGNEGDEDEEEEEGVLIERAEALLATPDEEFIVVAIETE